VPRQHTTQLVSRSPLIRRRHSLTTGALCQINQRRPDSLLTLPFAQTVFHRSLKVLLRMPFHSVLLLEQVPAHLCCIIHDQDRLSRWLPLTLPYPSSSTGSVVPRSSLLRPGVHLRVPSQLADLRIEYLDDSFLLASSQIYYSGSLQMSRHVHSSPIVLSQPDRQLDRR
jgi:hypothetical protein